MLIFILQMETVFFSDRWPVSAIKNCEKTSGPEASILAPATKVQRRIHLYRIQVTTKT